MVLALAKSKNMKVKVWDTYVERTDGNVMHFDILAPEEVADKEVIYNYGRDYLKTKGQLGQRLTSDECRLCHIEQASTVVSAEISRQGYYIIEMQNCY